MCVCVLDATQQLLQAPWAHCFATTPFPVFVTLTASWLLSLNMLAFALCYEQLRPGTFRTMGSGEVIPLTSTCSQGSHQPPAQWSFVRPRNSYHGSGSRWWCTTCGTWALRQDSCFSALQSHKVTAYRRGRSRCVRTASAVEALFGLWEILSQALLFPNLFCFRARGSFCSLMRKQKK